MDKNFIIDNIKDIDDINKLSIMLNEQAAIKHIKIQKTSISFECRQPEVINEVLKEAQMEYVVKEIVNSRKRVYKAPEKKMNKIFLFNHLESEDEANEIKNILSKYSIYENVEIDFANKLLTLTTSSQNAIKRISRVCEKVNPNISVEQWKRPFKSQDIFQEKYYPRYFRIAVLLVSLAIALVTRNDPTILTNIGWLIATIVISEKIIINAHKDLQVKQFLSENVLILVALLVGWIYGAFFEAFMVSLIYQFGDAALIRIIDITMTRIDELINPKYEFTQYISKTETKMTSVDDLDIDDQIIVHQGEHVPLAGKVMAGKAKLDNFAITGNDTYEDSKRYSIVNSGALVVEGELRIKITGSYESSAMSTVLDLAMNAPLSKSHTSKIIDIVSKIYTVLLVVIALYCIIVLPIMNVEENFKYMYFGAIILTMAGSFEYKQGASFGILAGVANAFSNNIAIKKNSGLDDLNLCKTIIYDRFDGVEVTEEEMELFDKLKSLHRKLIIFNDGPTDLENTEYNIYNSLSIEEKLDIMDKESIGSPIAYIGDNYKDVKLLQKAYVGISRGGLHNRKVVDNSDMIVTSSNLDVIYKLFMISKKQKHCTLENAILGIVVSLFIVLVALSFAVNWWVAASVYVLETIAILLNTHRIIEYK